MRVIIPALADRAQAGEAIAKDVAVVDVNVPEHLLARLEKDKPEQDGTKGTTQKSKEIKDERDSND